MVNLLQYRAWALSEGYFGKMYPVISNMLVHGHSLEQLITKKTIEDFMPGIQAMLAAPDPETGARAAGPVHAGAGQISIDSNSRLPVIKSGSKNIALIPVIGPLTKYGGMCSYGMQDYQGMINRANDSPGVDGMVMIMDSPGGTVDGTPEFGLAISSSPKPIGVFGDNMVASAAMWVASQASVIVGNKNNPTEFGSIGTLMIVEDWSKVMETGNAPKVEIIRAPQSTDKALVNPIEPMTADIRAAVKADLKDITDQFISTVKSGRGDKLNGGLAGLFNGKMFDAATARQNGLIDSVGTLQTAVQKVADLARQQSNQGTTTNQNKGAKSTMKFPKLTALFAGLFASKEGKEVNLKVSSEGVQSEDTASMEAAEQKVAEMETANATLTADNSAKAAKIAELEATVSSHAAKIAALETEKTTLTAKAADLQKALDEKPKGVLTTVIPKEDESTVDASEKYKTSIDAEAAEIRKQNANLSTIK